MTVSPFYQPQSMLAWNTLGWTAQNMAYPEPLPAMPLDLPQGVVVQPVTARFLWADGRPKQGNVKVTSDAATVFDGVSIGQFSKRFWLDKFGVAEILLPTSVLTPWTYSVLEAVPGGKRYTIEVTTDLEPLILFNLKAQST